MIHRKQTRTQMGRALAILLALGAFAPGQAMAQTAPTKEAIPAAARLGGGDGPVTAPEPAPLPETAAGPSIGPSTQLPLPRFVSMRSSLANVRRGPSKTHRIDWEFTRAGQPVEVIAEFGHWRRIRDHDGIGGWVHYSLVSGHRSVLVETDMLDLRLRPGPATRVTARLETGVIADLDRCEIDWCRISVAGYRGWAPKESLWGVGAREVFD